MTRVSPMRCSPDQGSACSGRSLGPSGPRLNLKVEDMRPGPAMNTTRAVRQKLILTQSRTAGAVCVVPRCSQPREAADPSQCELGSVTGAQQGRGHRQCSRRWTACTAGTTAARQCNILRRWTQLCQAQHACPHSSPPVSSTTSLYGFSCHRSFISNSTLSHSGWPGAEATMPLVGPGSCRREEVGQGGCAEGQAPVGNATQWRQQPRAPSSRRQPRTQFAAHSLLHCVPSLQRHTPQTHMHPPHLQHHIIVGQPGVHWAEALHIQI